MMTTRPYPCGAPRPSRVREQVAHVSCCRHNSCLVLAQEHLRMLFIFMPELATLAGSLHDDPPKIPVGPPRLRLVPKTQTEVSE